MYGRCIDHDSDGSHYADDSDDDGEDGGDDGDGDDDADADGDDDEDRTRTQEAESSETEVGDDVNNTHTWGNFMDLIPPPGSPYIFAFCHKLIR